MSYDLYKILTVTFTSLLRSFTNGLFHKILFCCAFTIRQYQNHQSSVNRFLPGSVFLVSTLRMHVMSHQKAYEFTVCVCLRCAYVRLRARDCSYGLIYLNILEVFVLSQLSLTHYVYESTVHCEAVLKYYKFNQITVILFTFTERLQNKY